MGEDPSEGVRRRTDEGEWEDPGSGHPTVPHAYLGERYKMHQLEWPSVIMVALSAPGAWAQAMRDREVAWGLWRPAGQSSVHAVSVECARTQV